MLNLDTHILIYALSDQLTKKEKAILSGQPWSISSIVIWEIAKLSQLKRIEIDLDDVWGSDCSVSEIIREEIRDAVRRKVKTLIRGKDNDLAKSIERYAAAQAKALEDKLLGIDD